MNDMKILKSNSYQSDVNQEKTIIQQMNSAKFKLTNGHQPSTQLHHAPSISKINNQHQYRPNNTSINQHNQSRTISNASRKMPGNSFVFNDRAIQLQQKLKNIHIFYKSRLEQQKSRSNQRNDVFLNIAEELQKAHQDKIANAKKLYEQAEVQKKDVGMVDERMNEIKASIDEILKQSSDLKQSNQQFSRQIQEKQLIIHDKEEELSKLKSQLIESRNQLQNFQRVNLKYNKRNKDIVSMIQKASSHKSS